MAGGRSPARRVPSASPDLKSWQRDAGLLLATFLGRVFWPFAQVPRRDPRRIDVTRQAERQPRAIWRSWKSMPSNTSWPSGGPASTRRRPDVGGGLLDTVTGQERETAAPRRYSGVSSLGGSQRHLACSADALDTYVARSSCTGCHTRMPPNLLTVPTWRRHGRPGARGRGPCGRGWARPCSCRATTCCRCRVPHDPRRAGAAPGRHRGTSTGCGGPGPARRDRRSRRCRRRVGAPGPGAPAGDPRGLAGRHGASAAAGPHARLLPVRPRRGADRARTTIAACSSALCWGLTPNGGSRNRATTLIDRRIEPWGFRRSPRPVLGSASNSC